MHRRESIAYVLIAIGVIALLARLTGGAGWLWLALVAAALLAAYAAQRTYGFLVLGGILAGTAAGIALQEAWRVDGVFLISLGAGIFAVDVVERRANRWPRTVGIVLALLGLVIALADVGVFGTLWFALLLIAIGVALIYRGGRRPFPPPVTPHPRGPSVTVPGGATQGTPVSPTPDEAVTPPLDEAAAEAARAAETPGPDGIGEAAEARRERLLVWRAATAEREGRPPQLLLSDETVDALAEAAPTDLTALSAVKGIGPVKLERYGRALLDVLAGRVAE
jgi:hypothetical protein